MVTGDSGFIRSRVRYRAMAETDLDTLFRNTRVNAGTAWLLTGLTGLVGAEATLTNDPVWGVFAVLAAVLAILPAVRFRDPLVMPPWEVMLLVALPMFGRTLVSGLSGTLVTFLAVAGVALVVAVELHTFTPASFTIWFAILLTVVATMATAGVWGLLRAGADWYLGIGTVPGNKQLNWEFVYSMVAGVAAGLVFEYYFRRASGASERVPEDVREEIEEGRTQRFGGAP